MGASEISIIRPSRTVDVAVCEVDVSIGNRRILLSDRRPIDNCIDYCTDYCNAY